MKVYRYRHGPKHEISPYFAFLWQIFITGIAIIGLVAAVLIAIKVVGWWPVS